MTKALSAMFVLLDAHLLCLGVALHTEGQPGSERSTFRER